MENQVLLILTVMLAILAAVNAIFITWAAVQDSRQTTVVARALGATPRQLAAGLCAAQVIPAVAGAIAGIAGGYGFFTVANQGGTASQPPTWWLAAAVLSTMIVVTGLTSVSARLSTRPAITSSLQADAQ